MLRSLVPACGVIAVCLSASVWGQEGSTLAMLRKAGILEGPGAIPVFFVDATKERALKFQRSLQVAHSWYAKELNAAVPLVLIVLDNQTYKALGRTPPPGGGGIAPRDGDPGLILMTPQNPTAAPVTGADPDHSPGGVLQGEQILFHEYGHILADQLSIRSANGSINEVIANVFSMAYIQADRADLKFLLDVRRNNSHPRPTPRYTALIDFDYLGGAIATPNRFWLQFHEERIGDALVSNQRLADVVKRLQQEFPARDLKQEGAEELKARLSRIASGLPASLLSQYGPTTITTATPVACDASTTLGNSSALVVRNNTANPITITSTNNPIPRTGAVTIAANTWRTFRNQAGVRFRISDGSCFVFRDEPTIVTIGPS